MVKANEGVWLPVLPDMKGFGPALIRGASQEADKSGNSIGKAFGGAIVKGVAITSAGVAAAGAALYKVGSVFDDVSDTIRAGTGATGDALDGLVKSAKNIGATVPAEFESIGKVVADVNTRMGLSGDTLETVASQYLEAGRVLGETVDVNKTSAAFNAFQIKGEDVVGAMDHLFQVSQATGVGMNELAEKVSKNAPALQTLGFSYEEATAMVGSFDKAGLNSSAVMASMSKGLVTLAKDGEEPQQAFQRTVSEIDKYIKAGDEAGALQLASKVFGTRGATQLIGALKSGTVNLEDMTKAAGQSGDTILGVGDDTADFAEEWMKFKNKVLVWLEPMGSKIFGALGTIMGEVTDGVSAFGAAWETNDGKITASGFPGFMQDLAFRARDLFDYFQQTAVPVLRDIVTWFQANKDTLLSLVPVVLTGAAAVGAYFAITKTMATYNQIHTWMKNTTLAQNGLNAALKANPIGLIITIIGALVAALVWLYQNNEDARRIMDAAWAGIQQAISWAWNSVIQPIWLALVGFVTNTLVPIIMNFWRNVIVPAWTGIQNAIKFAWERIILPAFAAIQAFIRDVLIPIFQWLYKNVIVPVWGGIQTAISIAWNVIRLIFDTIKFVIEKVLAPTFQWLYKNVIMPVWAGIETAVRNAWAAIRLIFDAVKKVVETVLAPIFNWLYKNVVKPAFEGISKTVKTIWEKILQPAFREFGNFIRDVVAPAFERGVKIITDIWEGIKAVVAAPINFVIGTVWNKGIVPTFNRIAEAVGSDARLSTFSLISSGPAAKGSGRASTRSSVGYYAKGGFVNEEWYIAGEEGPELIHRGKDAHRVYTAADTSSMLQAAGGMSDAQLKAAAGNSPAEAILPMGGWVEDAWNALKLAKTSIQLSNAAAERWVRGNLANMAGAAVRPLMDTLMSTVGTHMWGKNARGVGAKTVDGLMDWVRGYDEEALAGNAVYNGPLGAFHRPSAGPITSKFGPRWGSFHAGVDIAGGGPTYAALAGVVAKVGWNILAGKTGIGVLLNHAKDLWTYYGHNPSMAAVKVRPGQTVAAGQQIGAQGATGNVTGVHLHFEVQRGRVNNSVDPMPYLYDEGGWLEPGINLVRNASGRPEPVFTGGQFDELVAGRQSGPSQLEGRLYLDSGEFLGVVRGEVVESVGEMVSGLEQSGRQLTGVS